MQFTPNFKNFYGAQYQAVEHFQVIDTPVSTMNFVFNPINGDEQYAYGLNIKWINPLTGVKRLLLKYNGAVLTGVNMWRSARNLSTNANEDASQTQMYLAELQSGVPNCTFEGAAYFDGHRNGFARHLIVEGFQFDASASLGDMIRAVYRQARWNNNTTEITSITVSSEDGSNCIAPGSEFFLFCTY